MRKKRDGAKYPGGKGKRWGLGLALTGGAGTAGHGCELGHAAYRLRELSTQGDKAQGRVWGSVRFQIQYWGLQALQD